MMSRTLWGLALLVVPALVMILSEGALAVLEMKNKYRTWRFCVWVVYRETWLNWKSWWNDE
jgi:hypothetical protein